MLQIRNANNTSGQDVMNYLRVTAPDLQSIAQASVKYLVKLTSQSSQNSLYFIPFSVNTDNLPRYIRLNVQVVDKDATANPTGGIIKFYDDAGKLDTYPMGFYTYEIYEQTSSSNLDPTLATAKLEEGLAYVRDYSGNMEEVPDGYKEYNENLTQYVYP